MIKLPRFNIGQRIVDVVTGTPSPGFLRWINETIQALASAVDEITKSLERAGIAIETADAAVEAANDAREAIRSSAFESSLIDSYVPAREALTAIIYDPIGAPNDVTINVAAHERIYGNGDKAQVAGGSIVVSAFSTYYVYYNDAKRKGGTFTFEASTDFYMSEQSKDRHLVGVIKAPAQGDTNQVTGVSTRPPGLRGLV